MSIRTKHTQCRPAVTRGFSLVELLVVMALMSFFGLIFYGVFTFNVELSRTHSLIADMQQNLRVAQHDIKRFARMAGRGGLPETLAAGFPNGVAISVQNNVAEGTLIGGPGTPEVLEGTDILTIRGVFSNPVYQVKAPPGALDTGRFTISPLTPTGVEQDLGPLAHAVEQTTVTPGDPREPLLMVSPLGQYSIYELKKGKVNREPGINPRILGVELESNDNAGYRGLLVEGGNNPPEMTTVASIGIIEEYRYYIRKVETVPGRVVPRLSRARFFAGTNIVHPSDPTAAEDIADHIVDLQVALGIDGFGPGAGAGGPDGTVYEGARDDDADRDEWLFNHEDDVLPGGPVGDLELIRLTLLARTSQGDRKWTEPPLAWLEDHDYVAGPVSPAATDLSRRRRMAQTVVSLRNI